MSNLVSVLVAIILFYKNRQFSLPTKLTAFLKNFGLNIRATLAYLMLFLLLKTNLFLVNQLLELDQVGLFAIAAGLVGIVQQIPNVAGTVLFPKVASRGEKSKLAMVNKVAVTVLAALLLLGFGLYLVGKELIVMLYSDQFAASYEPLVWLLPGIIAFGFVGIYNTSLWGMGFPIVTIVSPLVAFIVNIFCCLWLIPSNGIVGAAQAATISFLLFGVTTLGYVFLHKNQLGGERIDDSATDTQNVWPCTSELKIHIDSENFLYMPINQIVFR